MAATENTKYDKTIVFCIVGESFSHNFLRVWTEIAGYCLMNNIKPVVSSHKHNTFVSKTYVLSTTSETNTPFSGKVDYDYIIYIKNTNLVTAEIIKKMIEQDLDILSCLASNNYNLRETNYIEHFELSDVESNNHKYGKFEDVNKLLRELHEDVKPETTPSTLLKVDYFDFNVVCIKKGVLEKMKLPWFNYEESVRDITGDIYFCDKCKKNGIDLYVDLTLVVNNEKHVVC